MEQRVYPLNSNSGSHTRSFFPRCHCYRREGYPDSRTDLTPQEYAQQGMPHLNDDGAYFPHQHGMNLFIIKTLKKEQEQGERFLGFPSPQTAASSDEHFCHATDKNAANCAAGSECETLTY